VSSEERFRTLLLEWYHADDGIRDEMEWSAIIKIGERYAQLVALGIDPYDPTAEP
jgi:hypothetical protein